MSFVERLKHKHSIDYKLLFGSIATIIVSLWLLHTIFPVYEVLNCPKSALSCSSTAYYVGSKVQKTILKQDLNSISIDISEARTRRTYDVYYLKANGGNIFDLPYETMPGASKALDQIKNYVNTQQQELNIVKCNIIVMSAGIFAILLSLMFIVLFFIF
ncbi:MAG: hypothetical protein LKG27_06045 [Clostridiaceae bacterium]|jgi:hypothetical protein|nr:hypothetical protein [Clostridiaceae bacterium]